MKKESDDHAEIVGLRICAWCNDFLGFNKFLRPKEEVGKITPISHGMCEECQKDFKEELDQIDPAPEYHASIV
jgi:hypothetical protein